MLKNQPQPQPCHHKYKEHPPSIGQPPMSPQWSQSYLPGIACKVLPSAEGHQLGTPECRCTAAENYLDFGPGGTTARPHSLPKDGVYATCLQGQMSASIRHPCCSTPCMAHLWGNTGTGGGIRSLVHPEELFWSQRDEVLGTLMFSYGGLIGSLTWFFN